MAFGAPAAGASRFPVHGALLTCVAIWGLAYTAIDRALVDLGLGGDPELAPVVLAMLRHVVASVALVAVVLAAGGARVPSRADLPRFVLLGVVSVITYHTSLYFGQLVVPPGTAALLVASVPIWTVVLASLLLAERLTLPKIAGIAVATLGVGVVILLGTPGRELSPVAIERAVVILVAPLSWALFTVLGKPLTARYTSREIATWATLAGTLLLLAATLPALHGVAAAQVAGLTPAGWGWVLFLGVLSSAVTTILWFFALAREEASRVAVYVYLMPVLAIVWAAALLAAPVTPFVALGGALIIGGIALTNAQPMARRIAARYA